MIQIQSVKILILRGIRELKLEMNCGSFVISGLNGSLKIIESVLTNKAGTLLGLK